MSFERGVFFTIYHAVHYSGPKGRRNETFFFQKESTFTSISSDWSVQLVSFFYERKALDLKNVLHTHIDDIGCLEKFLETPQLKISFQNHHFLHFLALSQTSKSGCQGVWNFKNRYVCTFGDIGCVLRVVWSRYFFLRKGMIPASIWKLSLMCKTSQKIFSDHSNSHRWMRKTQFLGHFRDFPWESGCQGVWNFKNCYVCTFGNLGCVLSMVWLRIFFLRTGMIPDK